MLRNLFVVFVLVNGILLGCSLAADDDPTSSTTEAVVVTTTDETPPEKTTSVAPSSTTVAPSSTISTTTTKPTTSTKPPHTTNPTTTLSPTPAPPKAWPQNIGNWSVSDGTVTCILMRGALELVVPLDQNATKFATVDVPMNIEARGTCGEIVQTLVLTWESEKGSAETNTVIFSFKENKDKDDKNSTITPNKFALENITGTVFIPKKYNVTEPKFDINLESLNTYQTSLNKSFKCESEQTLHHKDGKGVQLKLAHAQIEAFRLENDAKFGPTVECELDGAVADIVPIAVGASLAGLVVIVLIAYLVGRRRSRARGYQSV